MKQCFWLLLFSTIVQFTAVVQTVPVVAHPQTERYIPIGQSPGVTDQRLIGRIVMREGGRIEVDGRTVELRSGTSIWVDRSREGSAAEVGSILDCAPGRYVEVMVHDTDGTLVANWVKVRIEPS